MTPKTLGILALSAVAAVVIALLLTPGRETQPGSDAYLLPGLLQKVNDVTAIQIRSPETEAAVTIRRGTDAWTIEQQQGYRADSNKVRQLLLALAEAKKLEPKTANPEYFDRLGVGDQDGPVIALQGVETPELIIGNSEFTRDAFYTRARGEQQSWLASGSIEAPTDASQWIAREIVDIPAARVARVEILHGDGEKVVIDKPRFGAAQFGLQGMPEEAELKNSAALESVAGALAGLRADAVQRELEWPQDPTRFTLTTFDGLRIDVESAQVDENYFIRLNASTDPDLVARLQQAADTGVETAEQLPQPDLSVVGDQAGQLQSRFDGWIYQVPQSRYRQLTRRQSDLLKDS